MKSHQTSKMPNYRYGAFKQVKRALRHGDEKLIEHILTCAKEGREHETSQRFHLPQLCNLTRARGTTVRSFGAGSARAGCYNSPLAAGRVPRPGTIAKKASATIMISGCFARTQSP